MGSRRGKLVGKVLEAYKKDLKLSSVQISILCGSLLGDGTLGLGYKASNANYKVDHGIPQKEYVFWKYEKFKEWVLTPPKISFRTNENGEKYKKSFWFRTVRHPEITFFRNLFYPQGKKIVPKNIEKYLDPLGFAVWIMDDGSFNRGMYDISTYSFTETEITLLLQVLKNKFGLVGNYFNDRDIGFRMYFPKSQTIKISSLISPYVIQTMKYKLPLLTP